LNIPMPSPNNHYRFALTGYPLGHSLSPLIHSAGLAACGLEGEYQLRPVPPEDLPGGLAKLAAELRSGLLDGLNVTIPHKQAVFGLCDQLSDAARAIGAVNLLSCQNGRILGENSDAPGFLAGLALADFDRDRSPRQAVVLGAGGSARAVVYALGTSGWQVILLTRRAEQAQALAQSFTASLPAGSIQPGQLDPATLRGLSASLIVNTTPVGMTPKTGVSPWPETVPLPEHAVIYDLVYNPRRTALIEQAMAQGHAVIGGINMLVEQAAISFERWTGRPAPRQAMLAAVQS
jgi:shikimate dehydrogenase